MHEYMRLVRHVRKLDLISLYNTGNTAVGSSNFKLVKCTTKANKSEHLVNKMFTESISNSTKSSINNHTGRGQSHWGIDVRMLQYYQPAKT